MTANGAWNRSRNVLCERPVGLGEVPANTPTIRALKESCPGRWIIPFMPPDAGVAPVMQDVHSVATHRTPEGSPDKGVYHRTRWLAEKSDLMLGWSR